MKFLRDTWIIFKRAMLLSLQNPAWVIIGLIQPILYIVLFGPLLTQMANVPGFPPGNAWNVFVPGILVQLGVFGGAFVGFGIISEWRSGVIDRMMVTPASRSALIAGRVLRDVIVLLVQSVVLIAVAVGFGLDVPFSALVLALVLVTLLGAAFSALSYAAGLALKSEDALAPLLNTLALPIVLLSGILLPMSMAPMWLQHVSDVVPFKHMVDALRSIFQGQIWVENVGVGFGLAFIFAIFSLWLGAQVFRNQTR
jgi:ABC-2 type transport system permease protein